MAKPVVQRELMAEDLADIKKRLGQFLEPYQEILVRLKIVSTQTGRW